ncbi:hypothetical protein [Mycobacterium kubicae]|uniref:hypothetical protein n=1 Tax=Mycobacterium kubicae TaxID=120959 RepID=UPI001041C4D5|nr:hypothetical protein [Mycobacterium kubicae]
MRFPKPTSLVNEISEWWRYLDVKQATGYLCAGAGIGLTIAIKLTHGPNQAILAVLAIVAQGAAASLFSGHGKAHPSHAKAAFGRLLRLAQRVRFAEQAAQEDFEDPSKPSKERQTQMGILSTELSYIGDGIYSAAADWIAFNQPLNEMISEEQRAAMLEAARDARKAAGQDQPEPLPPPAPLPTPAPTPNPGTPSQ